MEPQIAQLNIARMLARLDSPVMADFVANLDCINGLAENAEGFVWRLKGEGDIILAVSLLHFRELNMRL